MAKGRGKVVLWHLAMAGAGIGALAAWRWQRRWGATAAEQRAVLPGDNLVPQPLLQATRAVGIDAPPSVVWPWLVQIGQDKAGFYSYAWLENLAGLDGDNANAVVPDWQRLAVGDGVRLAQAIELRVALAEPERALVLDNLSAGKPEGGALFASSWGFDFSWAFVLEPEGLAGTRLVVRERCVWSKWVTGLGVKAANWVSFVVTRGMLAGIKRRAEDAWLADACGPADAPGPAEDRA
ncbi:MAG: hypothetical protein LBD77_09660 [Bifidobacteriaceae bacterium]|jgi:hypothetical protein|nr:hypothetical protein [Bifidobacteriaceae bacterium]